MRNNLTPVQFDVQFYEKTERTTQVIGLERRKDEDRGVSGNWGLSLSLSLAHSPPRMDEEKERERGGGTSEGRGERERALIPDSPPT